MTTRMNIPAGVTTVGLTLLLSGTVFFTPDIFVSRYTTSPEVWLQFALAVGLFICGLFKKGNIDLPPPGYIMLILVWGCYHLARSYWSFESLVSFLTVMTAFLVFYWYWKEISGTCILFGLFVCLGLALSVWGLGQYMGWMPKTYDMFTMTGPFNNPAGISSSLALLYPFSLYFCYRSKEIIGRLSILASILMAVTVILCGARAAILAVAISTFIFIIHLLKRKIGISFTALHYGAMGVTCILLFTVLYFMKKDSADGRLLIWHCSGQLVKEAPLFGHGSNGFTANYMTQQADYFTRNPESKFAMLADNTLHPFNEFIKEVVEYGAAGLLLSVVLVVLPLYRSRKDKSPELSVVRLSLLSIGICSFFSYPFYYPFIRLVIILLFAYLVVEQGEVAARGYRVNYFSKSAIGVISTFILVITVYQVRIEYAWNRIARTSLSGFTEEMLPSYRELYAGSYLKKNALFLYNYASELNRTEEYEKSNMVLLECCDYMNDAEVQMLLASNFEKLDELDSAVQSLTLASRMIPVRFFPLYRLAKLYEKNKECGKAFNMAEKIIHKEVKIPSMKITVMKNEMKELITKTKPNE